LLTRTPKLVVEASHDTIIGTDILARHPRKKKAKGKSFY